MEAIIIKATLTLDTTTLATTTKDSKATSQTRMQIMITHNNVLEKAASSAP